MHTGLQQPVCHPHAHLSGRTRSRYSSRVQSAKWLSATVCGTGPWAVALAPLRSTAARWSARRLFQRCTRQARGKCWHLEAAAVRVYTL